MAPLNLQLLNLPISNYFQLLLFLRVFVVGFYAVSEKVLAYIQFLGAAGTVTGSKHLINTSLDGDGKKGIQVLIDCGLFQGQKEWRERNWKDLPIPAREIDAVILTHAHLDHCGWIPRLVKQGFQGPIFATAATIDLCGIILPDSGHLQEEDAAFYNKNREYALGNTPQQRFMGVWSDGVPVKELKVISKP